MTLKQPTLYTFRRCPYAIRARMALAYASIVVELREVSLREKPVAMLAASSKGTVPVLVLGDGVVIEQSVDIMQWALQCCDPDDWLLRFDDDLLMENDGDFKYWLDRYKYSDRYPEQSCAFYQSKAEKFVKRLDRMLVRSHYLLADKMGFADVAIFPFVRQFAAVDPAAFDASPFLNVRRWLNDCLKLDLFLRVMQKYPRWQAGDDARIVDWTVL